jgi:putative MATE family efflux protein
VDGIFVSDFVGEIEFAAVNFIMPFLMMLGGIGFMFGTGGSALIAKRMGEGKQHEANGIFSFLIFVSLGTGVVIAALGILFLRPIAALLGAEGTMLEHCVTYGRVILLALPALLLQFEFQSFFITAEKPKLSLFITLAAGVTNMVLDALFMAVFKWGVVGAAAATAISQCVGGFVPLVYFARKNSSLLRITRPRFDGRALLLTCTNGSSELLSNISMSLVSMLYNVQLLRYADEAGVSAYGVLMYVNFVFLAIFIGYSVGTAPLVSYHFGAQNHAELKSLLKKSLVLIGSASLLMLGISQLLGSPLASLFVGYNPSLFELTLQGFRIFSFSFLFAGIAIYGSSFFTALNNGPVSALISFLRTLVFQVGAVLLLPILLNGVTGIWLSVVVAELAAAVLTAVFMMALRRKYHY